MSRLNSEDWRNWIKYAERDRKEAFDALSRESWSEACFHAQQSCEKLLKGLLLKENIFLPIHDVKRLVDEASMKIEGLKELKSILSDTSSLTVHYYAARYPDAATRFKVKYNKEIAVKCVEALDKLWSYLREYVK